MQAILDQDPQQQPCTGPLKHALQGKVISLGEMPLYTRDSPQDDPWKFMRYPVNRAKHLLKVRLRSDQYFVDEEGIFRTGRAYGNLMHQLFSAIDTLEDVDAAVEDLHKEGLLPGKEVAALSEFVKTLLKREELAPWFSRKETMEIRKEHSLFDGSGQVLRPDRVMVEGEKATVVDFKFGETEKGSYRTQVSNYMEHLKQMGFARVEGYLWYVVLDRIVKIDQT